MDGSAAGGGAAKGRLVGFVALGALLLLVGVAFYSARDVSGPVRTETPPPAPPASPQPESAAPAAPQPAGEAMPPAAGTDPSAEIAQMPHAKDLIGARPSKGRVITTRIEDIALSPQARLLAERLKCVCGCNDMLSVCVCKKTPGSYDMKKYLQELVSAGKTPAEVESAMVARYGDKVLP